MKIQDKLRKPMLEAKYLNVDNTDRYRPIIRLFYLQYEKLKYWMYQEEVFEELKEDPYFEDYTPEQCQQDLAALSAWGNLVTIQDTRKVASIEEFKNKKFRYQLSETACLYYTASPFWKNGNGKHGGGVFWKRCGCRKYF